MFVKKIIATLMICSALILWCSPVFADAIVPKAAEPAKETTITVDSILQNDKPPPAPEPIKHYPIQVSETVMDGYKVITKTYALGESDNVNGIDISDFTKQGLTYKLADIIEKEEIAKESIEHSEKVEINTSSNKVDDILAQLKTDLYVEKDGFAGTLALDITSISTEVAGYKKNSYAVTKTREYPHLSSNDTSLVPKTITEGGTTYTVGNISFKAQDTALVDYESVPQSYTAYATYSAKASSSSVSGYVTTANYTGSLNKTVHGKTIYSAMFISSDPIIPLPTEPEPIPAPIIEPEVKNPAFKVSPVVVSIIATVFTVLAFATACFFIIKTISLYNVTLYNQDGVEFKKTGRVKLNYKNPLIDLGKIKPNKVKSEVFVIELSEKATMAMRNKEITVIRDGKEIHHVIEPDGAMRYQFEVDFSSEEVEASVDATKRSAPSLEKPKGETT